MTTELIWSKLELVKAVDIITDFAELILYN